MFFFNYSYIKKSKIKLHAYVFTGCGPLHAKQILSHNISVILTSVGTKFLLKLQVQLIFQGNIIYA